MKKLIIALALVALLAGQVFAGQMVTPIIDTTLDASPTGAYSDMIYIGDCSRVGFIVVYDETEVGGGVSAIVDITFNPTSTRGTPSSGYFYDFAGGSTLQTAETISADREYVFWLPNIALPYVQVRVQGTGTDADDTIDLTVYMITER